MTLTLHYRRGHPAGYTDDLGIIADRNQWVDEELAGWYCYSICGLGFDRERQEMQDWCDQNLKNYWEVNRKCVYISSEDDATLFKLRWS